MKSAVFLDFSKTIYPELSELIENQQINYGLARIHGQRHIARCLIYADFYVQQFQLSDDEALKVYFAICFHDLGREAEGEDYWTGRSGELAHTWLYNNGYVKYANDVAQYILQKDNSNYDVAGKNILHDVDCLDIMRPSTGRGGIIGFQSSYLIYFKNNYIQSTVIEKAWNLINLTESKNDTKNFLYEIINFDM